MVKKYMRCAKLNQDSYKTSNLVHVATDRWIRHKWYEFSVDDDSKDILVQYIYWTRWEKFTKMANFYKTHQFAHQFFISGGIVANQLLNAY